MAVETKIIERIQKLLALAGNNPNENEAALAASRAQELMLQHDLTMETVSTKVDARTSGITQTERTTLRKAGKPGGWKYALFSCVGQTSGCWVFGYDVPGHDASAYLIGRAQDVEMAHYLYAFLVKEIERLQQEFGKTRWAELREYAQNHGITTHDAERDFSSMGRHPLRAKDSWIRGAAEVVISTLHREHYERQNRDAATSALMVNKEAALRDWQAQQRGYKDDADYRAQMAAKHNAVTTETKPKPMTKRERASLDAWSRRQARKEETARRNLAKSLDPEAYWAGREAGRQIAVRPGVRSGTVAQKPDLLA